MKKIYFAALAMALTACVSNEDLNPVDNYGYIDVKVSNDPVMVTRAVQTADISTWFITTKQGNNAEVDWSEDKSYPVGDYVVYARSARTMEEANTKNTYGIAYYEGNDDVTVTNNGTGEATIECGTARNSKLELDITGLNNLFSDVNLNVSSGTGETVRNLKLGTGHLEAYYAPRTQVIYTIEFKFNGSEHLTTIPKEGGSYSATLGNAATKKIIKLKSNTNGTITIKNVTYNDEFTETGTEELTFDAVTGDLVSSTPE